MSGFAGFELTDMSGGAQHLILGFEHLLLFPILKTERTRRLAEGEHAHQCQTDQNYVEKRGQDSTPS